MTRRRESKLTRREFLAAATATVVVAGCAPFSGANSITKRAATPFTSSTPLTLGGDATIPNSLLDSLATALSGHGGVSAAQALPAPTTTPDLFVSMAPDGSPAPTGYKHAATVATSDWALVTHPRVPIEGVTHAQAVGLLSGSISDWSAVGAPYSVPVKRFGLSNLSAPDGIQLSGATSATSYDALLIALRATPGAVAVMPTEAVDWSVHHVGVDGFYPAQGRGSGVGLGSLPLKLYVSDALAKKGADSAKIGAGAQSGMASGQATLDLVTVGDIMLGRGVLNQMRARRLPLPLSRHQERARRWRPACRQPGVHGHRPRPAAVRSLDLHLRLSHSRLRRPDLRWVQHRHAGQQPL